MHVPLFPSFDRGASATMHSFASDQPNVLAFNNVNYTVRAEPSSGIQKWLPFYRTSTDYKRVLDNVTGQFETGQMVAVMGASGAGKTTLLAAITQRIRGNQLTGDFLLDNYGVTRDEMASVAGFVPQYDSAIEVLTVEEHLLFMAQLKLAPSVSRLEKREGIDSIMCQLGISKLAHFHIQRLSGGEKRKLTLATELIREPMFLFCDEPTTGLDSFNTTVLLGTLRHLTKQPSVPEGETKPASIIHQQLILQGNYLKAEAANNSSKRGVICCIHQPSSEVFEYFTHIVLMHEGRIVFQGSKQMAKIFFQKLGHICPPDYNLAEFYLNLITPQYFTNDDFHQHITQMRNAHNPKTTVAKTDLFQNRGIGVEKQLSSDSYNRNWMIQVWILMRRNYVVTKRSWRESIWANISLLIIAVMIGVLYSNAGHNGQTSVMNICGAIFLVVVQVFFSQYKGQIDAFTPQLPNIRREIGEGIYDLSAFYVANVITWVPRALVGSFTLFAFVYYLSDFGAGLSPYVQMSITLTFATIVSQSYGFMLGCVFGTGYGGEISAPIDMCMMLFGGLYLNLESVSFLKYFSLFYYPYEAMSYQYWTTIDSIDCLNGTSTLPCLRNGTEVLANYAFHSQWYTLYIDFGGMLLWTIVFLGAGFVGLKRYVNKEGFY